MARRAANPAMPFTEAPLLGRFALAADAGFEAVGFLPYVFRRRAGLAAAVSARPGGRSLPRILKDDTP